MQNAEVSQPAISHHLALLRNANLIESRRVGKFSYYRITPQWHEQAVHLLQINGEGEAAAE